MKEAAADCLAHRLITSQNSTAPVKIDEPVLNIFKGKGHHFWGQHIQHLTNLTLKMLGRLKREGTCEN